MLPASQGLNCSSSIMKRMNSLAAFGYLLCLKIIWLKNSKYPKAAKEFIRFMMEDEQFNPWLAGSIGYVTQPLRAYEKHPVWSEPHSGPYRDVMKVMRPISYAGKPGYASAGAAADLHRLRHVGRA